MALIGEKQGGASRTDPSRRRGRVTDGDLALHRHRWDILAPVTGVTLILLLVKVVGFTEKVVVAHYLGTTQQADCFYAALAVVWTIVFVVRELLQPAFVPVYVGVLQSSDAALAYRFFRAMTLILALSLSGVAAMLAGGSE